MILDKIHKITFKDKQMDILILLVLIFIVWKVMKMVYNFMQKKISNTDHHNQSSTKDIE